MSITADDLNAFHEFAVGKLHDGKVASVTDLVAEWEAARQLECSVEGIRESMADADAGRLISADEAFAQAKRKLGIVE